MKKTLSVLFLISFLAFLAAPVFAQYQAPKECCVLKRAIKLEGMTTGCSVNSVAAPDASWVGTGETQCNGTAGYCAESATAWGMICLLNTLYSVSDWIFVVLVALAGIFIIIGAMTLLMAAGNPEKVTSGRNYIMYAAIGLIVGLLAKAIPSLVRMISGGM